MSQLKGLLDSFRKHLELRPDPARSLPQRTWFAVYPPDLELALQANLDEFQIAAQDARYTWNPIDLTGTVTQWLEGYPAEERTLLFENPDIIATYRTQLRDVAAEVITRKTRGAGETTLTVLHGVMELYDFLHLSDLLEALNHHPFPGFLLIFFPGERDHNTYRFLSCRDGWDYLATPILAE